MSKSPVKQQINKGQKAVQHEFVVTFLGFPLFIYGELIVEFDENLLRRSEFEEVEFEKGSLKNKPDCKVKKSRGINRQGLKKNRGAPGIINY